MSNLPRSHIRPLTLISICTAIILCTLTATPNIHGGQNSGKAMAKNDIIGLLEGGVDTAKVGEAAQQFGIAFEMTAETETQLRDVGADDALIALLKRIAPKGTPAASKPKPASGAPPPPPVLFLEVTPGGAQVYVDDEPIGTTSQSGRLRLSQLQPGAHSVRVSMAGYSDFEQSVVLTAGETTTVKTSLVSVRPPTPQAPTGPGSDSGNPLAGGGVNPLADGGAGSAPAGGAGTTGEPGSLGVMIANQTPQGGRGAYISSVAPGSPADRAGLRPGFTIMSVNGQSIRTPQMLLDIISKAHAGDMIQIAYHDGSQMQWARAQLARRAAPGAPAQGLPPAAGGLVTAPPQTAPAMPVVTFNVMHDHGQSGQSFCSGVLAVGGGRISYRGNNSVHAFDFGAEEVKEAKKNGVYLVALGAFHIRLKSGPNYNFIIQGPSGQAAPPDEALRALGMAMGRN